MDSFEDFVALQVAQLNEALLAFKLALVQLGRARELIHLLVQELAIRLAKIDVKLREKVIVELFLALELPGFDIRRCCVEN